MRVESRRFELAVGCAFCAANAAIAPVPVDDRLRLRAMSTGIICWGGAQLHTLGSTRASTAAPPPLASSQTAPSARSLSARAAAVEKATSKCVLAASDGTQIRVSLPVASRSAYLRAALSSHFTEAAALCVKLPTLSAAAVARSSGSRRDACSIKVAASGE